MSVKMQMNESTDKNKEAFVCEKPAVQAVTEVDEIAGEIDRMIEEGGKDSPEQQRKGPPV
jgi:hypothetical protein